MDTVSTNMILEGLNPEQEAAVKCTEGPVLIVAGAGSGKTRVLTSKVAYLLAGGIDPHNVLALTFTKKAAGEMKERISLMVGRDKARYVTMGTFHSVFVRFLREWSDSIGYPAQFTIYDTSDSTSVIKTCIKELQLDDKVYKPREVLSYISMAKNNLIGPAAYAANPEIRQNDERSRKSQMSALYSLYQDKLVKAGVMDFDDILVNMYSLLANSPFALQALTDRFKYILVDEFQDTNKVQNGILVKLAGQLCNICVVGDDSQSIYAFRGAKVENILNFRKQFPSCRVFRLERNYRSTSTIVEAANSIIAKNENRIPKNCYSEAGEGEKIKILTSYTEVEEATQIVSDIVGRIRSDNAKYQDFAILYRTNAQSRAIEEVLRRRNLPYMIYSGNSFFERAEVKDMMAYFKLAVNTADEESLKRIVAKPSRGIGDTTMEALDKAAKALECTLYQAAFSEGLGALGLKDAAIKKLRLFIETVKAWNDVALTADANELARRIADESGLYAYFKSDTTMEGLARLSNVEELLNSVAVFVEEKQAEMEDEGISGVVTLADFIENVSLLSNVDIDEPDDVNNKIALMTVHSAKGLEFPYVYIAGMEENLFPSLSMLSSQHDIEEERRLFYVAVTRAQRAVCLSLAHTRMRNGKHENNPPSRFIREIDPKYILNPLRPAVASQPQRPVFGSSFRPSGQFSGRSVQTSRPSVQTSRPVGTVSKVSGLSQRPSTVADPDFQAVNPAELYAGERIEHNHFGAGVIKSINGKLPDARAIVLFDDFGEKTLLLAHAKMRPLKK